MTASGGGITLVLLIAAVRVCIEMDGLGFCGWSTAVGDAGRAVGIRRDIP